MKRTGHGFILILILFAWLTGCASFKPIDLSSQVRSGILVPKAANVVVLFDKSASMGQLHGKPMVNEATRLTHGKNAIKNMIATLPEIRLNTGLRTFWAEETVLTYGMKPLAKKDYTQAVNAIENVRGRTDMGKAITAAGTDLRGATGHSALIILSDFSDLPGVDDIRAATVMAAITDLNAEYGENLCVYAIQVGYTPDGKALSEEIVQNVLGGYTVNADKLIAPAAMAGFVEKVLTGDCSRYRQLAAKPVEKVVIPAAEPQVEEKVIAAVAEPKVAEKAVVAAAATPKIVILAFEDVHFDFDKATLKPEAQEILKRNVQLLRDNPKAKVRVAGYTSASGTPAYNQGLSERRASAVQEYLVNEGIITRDRLSTIGYGETNPAMYEAAPKELYSKAAKANMRVLFEVIVQ